MSAPTARPALPGVTTVLPKRDKKALLQAVSPRERLCVKPGFYRARDGSGIGRLGLVPKRENKPKAGL